jgi:hypothetical protein
MCLSCRGASILSPVSSNWIDKSKEVRQSAGMKLLLAVSLWMWEGRAETVADRGGWHDDTPVGGAEAGHDLWHVSLADPYRLLQVLEVVCLPSLWFTFIEVDVVNSLLSLSLNNNQNIQLFYRNMGFRPLNWLIWSFKTQSFWRSHNQVLLNHEVKHLKCAWIMLHIFNP